MTDRAFYVYIAGPMSGYPAEYLANCARMSALSRQFMDLGLCPINPAGDLLEGLASQTPMLDEQYKRRSMDLLRLLGSLERGRGRGRRRRDPVANSTSSQRRALDGLPDVLSPADVAEALGVGLSTVRRWIRVGELVTLDLSGDRLLIPKTQILDLIEKAGAKRRKCGETP